MARLFDKKAEVDLNDLMMVHPSLMKLIMAFLLYCDEHNQLCMMTSLKTDVVKKRKSTTHRDGRAVDFSSRGWNTLHRKRVLHLINDKYKDIAAISISDKKPRAIIFHDIGLGEHFHLQVKP